ncbi:MAG TPA: AraC family transcriptional regulator [Chitinophagaceae bacterium]|nr:AraC family transcriptional regulator [Chitinophagaceae bacterium]
MVHSPDILALAIRQTPLEGQLELLQEKDCQIPGAVRFTIRRYRRMSQWAVEDTGMLVYRTEPSDREARYLELTFCLAGNLYCRHKDTECDNCRILESPGCTHRVESLDLLQFRFTPAQLSQFVRPRGQGSRLSEDILRFRHRTSFSRTLPLCGKTRMVLEGLLSHRYSGSLENIFVNAQTQMLLVYSLDCMLGEKESEVVTCKFLANEADREKIQRARELLLERIGDPITIKELSRKVAMNECYLKKGFKEMYGTTIFDFYQGQRMEHARYLLYEKGLSVTDVSLLLGYSSISHFSTAFKKHTGLKPCELLFRG